MLENKKILINRFLNRKTIKNKVFCIGLHKTGTTSLYYLALEYGFRATHTTDWIFNEAKLKKFEFFCDGGSHFDGINEFDLNYLYSTYPKSLFILQTRDAKSWLNSKLKHAGWNENTQIQPNDINKITHENWKYKSFLNIQKFIEHKYNYEQNVISFFEENNPDRLLRLDITNSKNKGKELKRLENFLGLRKINTIKIPHKNKGNTKNKLPDSVLNYIHNNT